MTFTITFGWWLLPFAITLAAFAIAMDNLPTYSRGYGDGIVGIFVLGAAIIISLIAWLIWAVLT